MSAVTHTLSLGAEGDTLKISPKGGDGEDHDLKVEAEACKTHETVLAFLQQLQQNSAQNVTLEYWHSNNSHYHPVHVGNGKALAHPCPLDMLIGFVQLRILEEQHGVRKPDLGYLSGAFNAVGL